jgi:hypothetical protein
MDLILKQIRKDHKYAVLYRFDNGVKINKLLTKEQYYQERKKYAPCEAAHNETGHF